MGSRLYCHRVYRYLLMLLSLENQEQTHSIPSFRCFIREGISPERERYIKNIFYRYIIPCEFIGYSHSQSEFPISDRRQRVKEQHDELMSNFFAQVDALARGKTVEEVIADGVPQHLREHKVFPGDRGSLQILFRDEVNPYNLGQLLSLYEHRVAVQG